MDFRNKAISNRAYQSFAQNIDKELETRLRFYRKLIKINNDYSKNVATSDHGWQYKFEMLERDEELSAKKNYKPPELIFPAKLRSEKRAELDFLIDSLKKAALKKQNADVDDKTTKNKSSSIDFSLDNNNEENEKLRTKLLLNGISHDREGRYKYLRERLLKYPEEKYKYPVTSSMDYGWRLATGKSYLPSASGSSESTNGNAYTLLSVSKEIPSRRHGIKNDLQTSFYRPTGVLNDFWKNDTISIRKS